MPVPVVLGLLAITGVCPSACRYDDPVAPRVTHPIAAAGVVGGDSLCGKVSFKINSATSVDVTYPNRSTCGTGLKVIRGSGSTYSEASNRTLTINLAILNQGTVPVQLPVRLFVPSNGVSGIVPSGNPATKIVPLNPDSSPAGGGKVWLVGGTGTLNVGDSTALKGVQFQVQSPVTQATFSFQATAQSADTARPPIPTSMMYPVDTTLTVGQPGDTLVQYLRYLVGVRFDDTTSGPTVQTFILHFNATIVAGSAAASEYILRIPDPGTSLTTFDSLLTAMRTSQGVKYAVPIMLHGRIGFDSRYPDDGSGFSRSDWFSATPSHAIWPRLAVRAPLAWGCETGEYGGVPVKIGVMDWFFDTLKPDWAGSTLIIIQPDPSKQPMDPTPQGYSLEPALSHGTAVLGVLAAKGDDGVGIPGMIWKSNVFLYQLDTNSALPRDLAQYFATMLVPSLKAQGIHLFVTSAVIGDHRQFGIFRAALEDYLSWGGVIVAPTGDVPQTFTVDAFVQAPSVGLQGMTQALASFYQTTDPTALKQRILIVSGTSPGNTKWSGATLITGAMDIAAPADNVTTLKVGLGAPSQDVSGTSLSVPFVGGVAAQILAMDPQLPIDSVKSYIVNGAQVMRANPSTGQLQAPTAVNGIPGVFQLDAYGSLTLLAANHTGVPICGFPVSIGVNADQIELHRPVAGTEVIPIPQPNSGVYHPSVAQGGRLISVVGGDPNTGQILLSTASLTGSSWSFQAPITGYQDRVYLEHDTAYIRPTTSGSSLELVMHRPGGNDSPVDIFLTGNPPSQQPFLWPTYSISPAGDQMMAGSVYLVNSQSCGTGTGVAQYTLIPLPGGQTSTLLSQPTDQCRLSNDFAAAGAWSPGGQRLMLSTLATTFGTVNGSFQVTSANSQLIQRRYFPGSPVTEYTLPLNNVFVSLVLSSSGALETQPSYSVDGLFLNSVESPFGTTTCNTVLRSATNGAFINQGSCAAPVPYIPNLRAGGRGVLTRANGGSGPLPGLSGAPSRAAFLDMVKRMPRSTLAN